MKNTALRVLLLLLLLPALPLSAQVPQLLEYDGFLAEGHQGVTGNRTIGVRLYSASTNGTLLYSETIGTVQVTAGDFYFQYGAAGVVHKTFGSYAGDISQALTGNQHWLALTINGTEQVPRERLLSVPFALKSADAQVADADLRKIAEAVGKIVSAFGGNSSNLLTNPSATVATIEKQASNLQEISKRFRVISLSGNLSFGNSSNTGQLTIQNTGIDRLKVSAISFPPSFSGNWSGGTIEPGASRSVQVVFAPGALGIYKGNITVTSDATFGSGVISCSGIGSRVIQVQNLIKLNFGKTIVNSTATANLTIQNRGTMALNVSQISSPTGFAVNWNGGLIAAGGNRVLTITFSPTEIKNYSGNITIFSNSGNSDGVFSTVSNRSVEGLGSEISMVDVLGGVVPMDMMPANLQNGTLQVSNFKIGKYEVRWDEWKSVVSWAEKNGYQFRWNPPNKESMEDPWPNAATNNHPVGAVSYIDILLWCNALSEMLSLQPCYLTYNGNVYRGQYTGESLSINLSSGGYYLPSAAEWKWAAMGGVNGNGYKYSGSNDLNQVGWWAGNSGNAIKPVGLKAGNELGIHDMSGNILEWSSDSAPGLLHSGFGVVTPIPRNWAFGGAATSTVASSGEIKTSFPIEIFKTFTYMGFRIAKRQ